MSRREVIIASSLGFCKGVERALDKAFNTIKDAKKENIPCYLYGDIVHNKEVVEAFDREGVKKLTSPEEANISGYLIIRAHGISDYERECFTRKGFRIVDATCPVVLKNQRLVRESMLPVIIIGYPKHAEVLSLLGSALTPTHIISSVADVDNIPKDFEYNAVLQTTFSDIEYEKIRAEIEKRGIKVNYLNSICISSKVRRESVINLSKKVEAIVVVGDNKSANTRELALLAEENGCHVFRVEKASSLPEEVFAYQKIGVTAGASTPSSCYEEVIRVLRSKNGR